MAASGLKKETAGALAYVLGPITGVIFLIIDKDPFVRFHAVQSIVVLGGLMVLQWVLAFTIVLALLAPLVWILSFILWLLLIYKAWQGQEWEVPVFNKITRQVIKKV